MGALRQLELALSYDSGQVGVDVVGDFYVPALACGSSYDRLAGFFSSSSLAVASRGIAGLVANGGSMRLATSPRLSPDDLVQLTESGSDEEADAILRRALTAGLAEELSDEIARDHVRALGWLIREGRLEMRIVVPSRPQYGSAGLFHLKVGLIRDDAGDCIAFDGSVNESRFGWLVNLERFSVFRSWVQAEEARIQDCDRAFNRYWIPDATPLARVVALPDALAERLIESAPRDFDELSLDYEASRVRETGVGWGPEDKADERAKLPDLRWYQQEAVEQWEHAGRRGILEMATGTGKTITALAAAIRLAEVVPRLMIVVAVPQTHLAHQWSKDVEIALPDAKVVIGDSDHPRWEQDLKTALAQTAQLGSAAMVCVVTHATARMPRFLELVERARRLGVPSLLVADEAHALGARKMSEALSEAYQYRLALSATPERHFDDEGSELLREYFGGTVYEFGLAKALAEGVLTPYEYHFESVSLTEEEIEEYRDLTLRAMKAMNSLPDTDGRTPEERYLHMRAAVAKKAENKLAALHTILSEIGTNIRHCIVYCLDREQMDLVAEVLGDTEYRYFTGEETAEERRIILGAFERGDIRVLVAIKCLDEGVDVRQARTAVILASSTNPRESVQRRGRLLRLYPGKDKAVIHDVLVRPALDRLSDERVRNLEVSLFMKELRRLQEFSESALNASECYRAISEELSRVLGWSS